MTDPSENTGNGATNRPPFYRRWFKIIAAGAFMFFLLKGIAWLVFLGLAVWGLWG
ncbi:MAG: hypothetical protein ACON4P_08690 [Candidatus Puniceispirillales bacterium]